MLKHPHATQQNTRPLATTRLEEPFIMPSSSPNKSSSSKSSPTKTPSKAGPSARPKSRPTPSPRSQPGPSSAGSTPHPARSRPPTGGPQAAPWSNSKQRETSALPAECWINIFQQMSEEDNEDNCNVFEVMHANANIPEGDEIETPPFDGSLTVLPRGRREALWNPPPSSHRAITQVNRGLRHAALTVGAFIFGPGEHDPDPNPDEAGGFYFRWDSDILFLDMDFWRAHFYYLEACYTKYQADRTDWEEKVIEAGTIQGVGPQPEWDDYDPEILPAMLKSHKAKVKHIGLPHRMIWAESTYNEVFRDMYHHFPGVEYIWIYRPSFSKRPKGVSNEIHMSVSRLSVDDKQHLNIRKYFEVWEDPNTGALTQGPTISNVALKHANMLRYKKSWIRDPDVAPKAIRFRRHTQYRPSFPYGVELPEDPNAVEMWDYFDAGTDLDVDSEFESEDDDDDDDA
ncbi:hypothetical protein QBC34DRAFT_454652 [Podospora aff. communis PSN243]|uniref:Uncharacterized protein n=1 Tax=Podospora aff. communis PSN243 TaxID=3040156 RepID=A0AAV9G1R9_9PEZI|nr:hypothetical protein QBC34DRAFT_454652 [Podospora aff. communis PSN243]